MINSPIIRFAIICFCFLHIPGPVSAQKKFHLVINLPAGIDKDKMEVRLENGKTTERIKTQSASKNRLILSAGYYALYAAITLHYPPDSSFQGFTNTFFVGEKSAIITFLHSNFSDSLLAHYTLKNVLDFKDQKKQMREFTKIEYQRAREYETKFEKEIFSGTDTAVQKYYFHVLMKALGMKEVAFATAHPDSYFSFYSFKLNTLDRGGILSPDSMLMSFNVFPDKFRFSDEGNYLLDFIIARTTSKKGGAPIDFIATDIAGKTIELSKLKGRKYVMIHFWGTWCSPCIKELPALKRIDDIYRSKDLEMISVSVSSDDKDFKKIIKKYEMTWTQVYNDLALYDKFGSFPTPRIYLIDKNWKVIYDNGAVGGNKDVDLKELHEILSKITN